MWLVGSQVVGSRSKAGGRAFWLSGGRQSIKEVIFDNTHNHTIIFQWYIHNTMHVCSSRSSSSNSLIQWFLYCRFDLNLIITCESSSDQAVDLVWFWNWWWFFSWDRNWFVWDLVVCLVGGGGGVIMQKKKMFQVEK